MKILKENKAGFEQLAALLLEKEVIFSEDLERIFGPRKGGVNPNAVINDDTPIELETDEKKPAPKEKAPKEKTPKPEEPAEPETPVEIEAPAEPETPAETEAPAEPETPSEPEAPAEPESPSDPETGSLF